MDKTIYLHKIHCEKLPMFANCDCKIKSGLKSLQLNNLIRFSESSAVIEPLISDDNYFFGSFGKLEDFEERILVRSRPKDNLNQKEDLVDMSFLIENFTYFCIDLNNYNCALINNPRVLSFRKFFQLLLWDENHLGLNSFYEKIEVIDLISDDIRKDLGRLNHIGKIKIKYDKNNKPTNSHLFLGEVSKFANFEDDEVLEASIDLTLNTKKNHSKFLGKLAEYKSFDENYSEFKVSNDDLTVDLIRNIITKKTPLNLSDDDVKNNRIIYNELTKILQQID